MESKTDTGAEALKRLYWHSRRGMRELDLILVPFASQRLSSLSAEELALYRLLLEQEDQDLFMWLTQRAPAPTEELRAIVSLVLESDRGEPVT